MLGFDRFARIALLGALLAALGLGGCGRKGALDPPPSASIANPQAANSPPALGEQPSPFETASPGEHSDGAAAASQAPPAKKTFILDWLLK